MSSVVGEQPEMGWWGYTWQEHRGWVITFSLLAVSLIIWKINGAETVFPQSMIEAFPFAEKTDAFKDAFFPYIQPTTRAMAAGVTWFYEVMVDFLTFTQWQVVFVILVGSRGVTARGLRGGVVGAAAGDSKRKEQEHQEIAEHD